MHKRRELEFDGTRQLQGSGIVWRNSQQLLGQLPCGLEVFFLVRQLSLKVFCLRMIGRNFFELIYLLFRIHQIVLAQQNSQDASVSGKKVRLDLHSLAERDQRIGRLAFDELNVALELPGVKTPWRFGDDGVGRSHRTVKVFCTCFLPRLGNQRRGKIWLGLKCSVQSRLGKVCLSRRAIGSCQRGLQICPGRRAAQFSLGKFFRDFFDLPLPQQ